MRARERQFGLEEPQPTRWERLQDQVKAVGPILGRSARASKAPGMAERAALEQMGRRVMRDLGAAMARGGNA